MEEAEDEERKEDPSCLMWSEEAIVDEKTSEMRLDVVQAVLLQTAFTLRELALLGEVYVTIDSNGGVENIKWSDKRTPQAKAAFRAAMGSFISEFLVKDLHLNRGCP